MLDSVKSSWQPAAGKHAASRGVTPKASRARLDTADQLEKEVGSESEDEEEDEEEYGYDAEDDMATVKMKMARVGAIRARHQKAGLEREKAREGGEARLKKCTREGRLFSIDDFGMNQYTGQRYAACRWCMLAMKWRHQMKKLKEGEEEGGEDVEEEEEGEGDSKKRKREQSEDLNIEE